MSTYLIGDIHGCFNELKKLLEQVSFNAKLDTLWLTGDLVARGPDSLKVMRLVYDLDNNIHTVLGNHDLHLIAVYAGVIRNNPKDCVKTLLEAPDADKLINWLRHQPVLRIDKNKKLIMVHAGIHPQWDLKTAICCAQELEIALRSSNYASFLGDIYTNTANNWSPTLSGLTRLQFIANVFTRMRYCFPNGQLDMYCKYKPELAPVFLQPWFKLSKQINEHYNIVFGHWSSLSGEDTPPNIYGIDTGCCWGNKLTLLRWEDKMVINVLCKKDTNIPH